MMEETPATTQVRWISPATFAAAQDGLTPTTRRVLDAVVNAADALGRAFIPDLPQIAGVTKYQRDIARAELGARGVLSSSAGVWFIPTLQTIKRTREGAR